MRRDKGGGWKREKRESKNEKDGWDGGRREGRIKERERGKRKKGKGREMKGAKEG